MWRSSSVQVWGCGKLNNQHPIQKKIKIKVIGVLASNLLPPPRFVIGIQYIRVFSYHSQFTCNFWVNNANNKNTNGDTTTTWNFRSELKKVSQSGNILHSLIHTAKYYSHVMLYTLKGILLLEDTVIKVYLVCQKQIRWSASDTHKFVTNVNGGVCVFKHMAVPRPRKSIAFLDWTWEEQTIMNRCARKVKIIKTKQHARYCVSRLHLIRIQLF